MSDEITLAGDAKALLENPLLVDAFLNIRENIVSQLESLPPDNDRLQLELVISLQMIAALKNNIYTHVETAQLNEYNTNGAGYEETR